MNYGSSEDHLVWPNDTKTCSPKSNSLTCFYFFLPLVPTTRRKQIPERIPFDPGFYSASENSILVNLRTLPTFTVS